MRINLEDGKYTLVFEENTGRLYALRYGEPWRESDLCGDNLVLALGQKIEELELSLAAAKKENQELKDEVVHLANRILSGEIY